MLEERVKGKYSIRSSSAIVWEKCVGNASEPQALICLGQDDHQGLASQTLDLKRAPWR